MFNRCRLTFLSTAACLLLASGAAAAPSSFTVAATPSHVKPSSSTTYTVTLTNSLSSDPQGADRATISVDEFQVVGPPPTASVTGCGNPPWDAEVVGNTITLSRRTGPPSENNLCPGGILTVVFTASSPATEGSYTWPTAMFLGDEAFTGGPDPTVIVDGAPPETTINPGAPTLTNQPSASFSFNSNEPGSTFECSLDGAAFTACTSPKSYTGLGAGMHTFHVRAIDLAGNTDAIPASHSWSIDLTAPTTTIEFGPPTPTSQTSASFSFSSNEVGSTFECSLDGGAFAACTSPKSYTGLPEGLRTFQVRAIDPAGNTDATPATHTWTIDLIGPATTILTRPASATNSTSASFIFSSEAGTTFECSLDGAAFFACTNPKAYSNLVDGPHVFAVRAIDSAQNTGPASSHSWTIDTRPPTAAIASGPAALSTSRSAALALSADEPSAFQCQLDGGGFQPCGSPASYQGLGDGAHTFAVTATDAVGNTGASSSYAWTIDATAPETTLGSGPRSGTTLVSATFRFSANEPGTFECSFDGAAFAPCTSPKSYTGLRRSAHSFEARAIDAAGNRDPTPAVHRWTIAAVPRRAKATSALLAPRAGARVTSPPRLMWRRVPRASFYNVQLYRGRVKVLSSWPTRPRLQLRKRWTYLGRKRKLAAGTYRWYVWPGFRANRYGRLLGQSTFRVTAASTR